jgi:gamma-glutamyltranspeptidase/glutathione hydrolase
MILGKSVYHPLRYLYKPASFLICIHPKREFCNSKQHNYAVTSNGTKSFVSTSHYLATDIGYSILEKNGNAVDAAVAIGYTLAVVDPCCGNIGGGGFMLIRLPDGRQTFIDFRETAPLNLHSSQFLDSEGNVKRHLTTRSYLSVGVPGTVMGLDEALSKYGTMTRQEVMLPAVHLASDGFILTDGDIQNLKKGESIFRSNTEASSIFLHPTGRMFLPGERLVQSDLGKTLNSIRTLGPKAFYDGEIAKTIVENSTNSGGVISTQDFSSYSIVESTPLSCNYRGYTVTTAPLPGGGITLCQMLKILEHYNITEFPRYSSNTSHRLVSAMLFSYIDRNTYLGDPNFIKTIPNYLLSPKYIDSLQKKIPEYKAPKFRPTNNIAEGNNTTHFSILDKNGMAVSVTYTINTAFGSGLIAGDTGFFLNNEINDFTIKLGTKNEYEMTQSANNRIEPGKRPLSSMTPTILTKQDKLFLVTGSPGGSTIPTTLMQTIVNIVDYKMTPDQAINSPRIHYQGSPNFVITEPFTLSEKVFSDLWRRGYRVIPYPTWGGAESIMINPNGDGVAVIDTRKTTSKPLAQ